MESLSGHWTFINKTLRNEREQLHDCERSDGYLIPEYTLWTELTSRNEREQLHDCERRDGYLIPEFTLRTELYNIN